MCAGGGGGGGGGAAMQPQSFGTELSVWLQVSKELKTVVEDRTFDEILSTSVTSAGGSFAMTPEGALMLIGTPQGQVQTRP